MQSIRSLTADAVGLYSGGSQITLSLSFTIQISSGLRPNSLITGCTADSLGVGASLARESESKLIVPEPVSSCVLDNGSKVRL
jgi:hypothetical protein